MGGETRARSGVGARTGVEAGVGGRAGVEAGEGAIRKQHPVSVIASSQAILITAGGCFCRWRR